MFSVPNSSPKEGVDGVTGASVPFAYNFGHAFPRFRRRFQLSRSRINLAQRVGVAHTVLPYRNPPVFESAADYCRLIDVKGCKNVPGVAIGSAPNGPFSLLRRSRKRVFREFDGQDNYFLGIYPGLPGPTLADRPEEHGHES